MYLYGTSLVKYKTKVVQLIEKPSLFTYKSNSLHAFDKYLQNSNNNVRTNWEKTHAKQLIFLLMC